MRGALAEPAEPAEPVEPLPNCAEAEGKIAIGLAALEAAAVAARCACKKDGINRHAAPWTLSTPSPSSGSCSVQQQRAAGARTAVEAGGSAAPAQARKRPSCQQPPCPLWAAGRGFNCPTPLSARRSAVRVCVCARVWACVGAVTSIARPEYDAPTHCLYQCAEMHGGPAHAPGLPQLGHVGKQAGPGSDNTFSQPAPAPGPSLSACQLRQTGTLSLCPCAPPPRTSRQPPPPAPLSLGWDLRPRRAGGPGPPNTGRSPMELEPAPAPPDRESARHETAAVSSAQNGPPL